MDAFAERANGGWPGLDRLAAVAELSIDALVLIDRNNIVQWASASVTGVLGYAPEMVIGRRPDDFVIADDRDAWRAFADDLMRRPGAPMEATFRCIHHDGSVRWTYGVARNLLDEPRVAAIVIYFRDVTPAREREQAIKDTQDRYRQLFEDATDVVFEADHEGYFRLVNPSTLHIFGYSEAEVIGRRFTEFIRTDYRRTVFEHYRRQLSTGERSSYIEFPAITKDQREIWLGQNAWIFFDAHGEFRGMRAVARDITERRHAEAALRQAQKMEAVGRLAGGIAHDFNNLLTAIRGNAELLSHTVRADPLRAAEVDEILHASDRAATLTRQLLLFSRKQDVTRVVLDLNDIVETVTRLARRLIGPDKALEIQKSAGLKPVMADAAQVEQLLLNLILNARDAVASGGHIIVSTSNCTIHNGSIEAAGTSLPDGVYARLRVIDDGVGMDQATQARIFEPFFTTKEPGRGTGLGLSTVYGIVRQMGGGITVDSELGKGATFTVYLPASTADTSYA